jgi:hypothetical protein
MSGVLFRACGECVDRMLKRSVVFQSCNIFVSTHFDFELLFAPHYGLSV